MKKKSNNPKPALSFRDKNLQEKNVPKRFSKVNSFLSKHTLLVSILINAFLFTLTYRIYTPYFQVNDDVAMMLLSSGTTLTIAPTEYLLSTNILLGMSLKELYSITANIPWYSLYLVMSLLIAHIAIFYVILKRNSKLVSILLYGLCFVLCSGFLLTSLQFTMVASSVAVAGIALLFIKPLNAINANKFNYQNTCGIMLLFLSSLIRFDATIQMCILSLPIWAIDILYKDSRAAIIKIIPLFVIALLLCYSANYYNNYRYQHWGNYNEFNSLRAQFVDNRVIEKATSQARIAAFKKAGWSETDYYMLREWFFMNDTIYNVEKFKLALSELPRSEQKITFDEVFNYQKLIFNSNSTILLSCLIISVFLFFFLNLDSRGLSKVVSTFALVYLLLLFINYYFKPPPLRVIYPMFAYLGILPLLIATDAGYFNFKKINWIRFACIASFAICLPWAFKSVKVMQKNNSENIQYLTSVIKNIINKINPNKNELFVVWGNGFPYEFISPFTNISFMKDFVFLGLGTTQLSTTSKEILNKYNIKDIYSDLAIRKDIHLIVGANAYKGGYIDLFNNYMQQHYHKAIKAIPVYQFDAFVVLNIGFVNEGK